jgi:hypothetical protein
VKEIIAYEDVNGIQHESKQACLLADAKIAVIASIDKETVHGEFFPDDWLDAVSIDVKLQRALIIVLGMDMAKISADIISDKRLGETADGQHG